MPSCIRRGGGILSRFVSGLAAIGGLRPGLDVETATDHVWSLASPELFLVWTRVGERDAAEHRDWIAQALTRLLLKEA